MSLSDYIKPERDRDEERYRREYEDTTPMDVLPVDELPEAGDEPEEAAGQDTMADDPRD
jgi:hypothetical protein